MKLAISAAIGDCKSGHGMLSPFGVRISRLFSHRVRGGVPSSRWVYYMVSGLCTSRQEKVFSHKRSFLSLERIREVDVYSSQIAHEPSLSSQASRLT